MEIKYSFLKRRKTTEKHAHEDKVKKEGRKESYKNHHFFPLT